eukprot:gene3230-5674_t
MKSLDYLLLLILTVYIFICPFTKVEESFNIQAVHDLIYHSSNLTSFDHHEFPGVVPRTFLGPIIISTIMKPFLFLFSTENKFFILIFARFILGFLCIICQSLFRESIKNKFGKATSNSYALILISQFHLLFYMSRPLPNTFALMLTFIGFKFWLDEQYPRMFLVLGICASIFRGELFVLIFPIALYSLLTRKINLFVGIFVGVISILFGSGFSIFVDSFFWRRILWPEGEVLFFNTILNKSSEWGIMSWHWYFSSALPRSMLYSLLLIPLGIFDKRTRPYLICSIVFIGLYSFLPHKELRFIFYAIPLLNLVAAAQLGSFFERKQKFYFIICLLGLICSFFISSFILYISSMNYYGGDALIKLHQKIGEKKNINIHINPEAAMNGINRFLELKNLNYSKEEKFHDFTKYDFMITNTPDYHKNWFKMIDKIDGFSRLNIKERKIEKVTKLYLMKKERKWKKTSDLAPVIYWAQFSDKITLTLNLVSVQNPHILIDDYTFHIDAQSKGQNYEANFILFDEIKSSETDIKVFTRYIKITMFKKNKIKWKRLTFDSVKKSFIRIDWDSLPKNVEDDDEEDEENEVKKNDENISERLKKFQKFLEWFKLNFKFLNSFSEYLSPQQFSFIVFFYLIFIIYLIAPKIERKEKIE